MLSLFETRSHISEPARHLNDTIHTATVQLEWRRRHVILSGYTNAPDLTVAFSGRQGVVVSNSFELQLPRPDKFSGVNVLMGNSKYQLIYSAPNWIQKIKTHLVALPKILLEVVKAIPEIQKFLITGDPATASHLRISFGLETDTSKSCIIPDKIISEGPIYLNSIQDCTIVIPVYNAQDQLSTLLHSLEGISNAIVFVNDGSSDPSITTMLSDFSIRHKNVKIIDHSENRGFVSASNTGLKHAKGHIVLLNSDAIPPSGDWVSRLISPIIKDSKIATVTPFSNNAEIISIPSQKNHQEIDKSVVDQINRAAIKIDPRESVIDLPTGIGFCMAINRDFFSKIGGFDTDFGRGYGEEVDWCQKAMLAGGRNVGLASLFVGHTGGSSFGDQKSERVRAASKIITARYPDYDERVQTWVQNAPAQAQSLVLSISWLAAVAESPIPVFVGHSMGGGAEAALQKEVEESLKTSPGALILRVGGPSIWRIELKGSDFLYTGDAQSVASVLQILAPLRQIRLIYSCGVGGRHPLDAPHLLGLLNDARSTLEVRAHDFFVISPSWNLLNRNGRFEGVPELCSTDSAHTVPALNGRGSVSHRVWRSTWGSLLESAKEINAFSQASRLLVCQAYPQISNRINVRPHQLANAPRKMRLGGHVIGVLGSLNRAKGAEVVQRLSQHPNLQRKVVILGEMDGAFSVARPHVFHGRYAQDQIVDLGEKYDIGLWLIPSICPETFSFATHEALATGLPVLAFARGAQGEAVALASNGHLMNVDPDNTTEILSTIESTFQSVH